MARKVPATLKQPTTWSGIVGLAIAGLTAATGSDWSGVVNGMIVVLQGVHLIMAKEQAKQ